MLDILHPPTPTTVAPRSDRERVAAELLAVELAVTLPLLEHQMELVELVDLMAEELVALELAVAVPLLQPQLDVQHRLDLHRVLGLYRDLALQLFAFSQRGRGTLESGTSVGLQPYCILDILYPATAPTVAPRSEHIGSF